MNQNVEYTVITEKMLGSWLPKCNNLYDIIYQGIVIEYLVCARAFRRESKNTSQYLHGYEHTHRLFICIQK